VKCFFCKNLLSDYLDNIIDGELENKIKSHLASCKDCSAYFSELERGYDLLNQVQLLNPGGNFYDSVKDHVNGNTWINKNYRRFVIPASVKVPMILLICLTLAIIISFILVERSKISYLSKINLELFQSETREHFLSSDQKENLKTFVNNLSGKIKVKAVADSLENEDRSREKLVILKASQEEKKNPDSLKTHSDTGQTESKTTKTTWNGKAALTDRTASQPYTSTTSIASASSAAKKNKEPAPEKLTATNNLIFKLFVNSYNLAKDTKSILDIVKAHGAVRASRTKLGSIEEGGSYFHMYLPQKNYAKLLATIKEKFDTVTVVKEESDWEVTNFQYRVIIWIENLSNE